jgi:hypothetical protein
MKELTIEQLEAERKATRERVARFRANQKQKAVAAEHAAERAEIRSTYCFYEESAPRVDAVTYDEVLSINREFLRALRKPDCQAGETLRDIAKRAFHAWIEDRKLYDDADGSFYVPGFDRKKQRFSDTDGFLLKNGTFTWEPPTGCDEDAVIDVTALLPLPPAPPVLAPEPFREREPSTGPNPENEIPVRDFAVRPRWVQDAHVAPPDLQEFLNR